VTTILQGTQIRQIALGIAVSNASPKTVPLNTTLTIFTVSGGKILITSLVGVVTTVIGGTTPALKLVSTPTTGTASDMCTALTITGTEVGTMFSMPSAPGSALAGVINKSGSVAAPGQQVVNIGTIGMNDSAADATGAIQWFMTYVPLDSGASVVAA
jgi:hypothetical protein